MDSSSNSFAWLARGDGSVIVGHAPFEARADPPHSGVAFFPGDFSLTDPLPWKIPARAEIVSSDDLSCRFYQPSPLACRWHPLDAAPFSVVFQEIMAAIHSGVFEKTVPVVTEHGTSDSDPSRAIVAAMIRQQAPLRSYGWVEHDRGFAGATPELLFSLDSSLLETMALAGTARSEDRDVFAVDEKEVREHEYVAQTLVSKLLDLGNLERKPREILDLGPIVHFLTTFRLDLHSTLHAADLLRRLHPTPALGPLPRTRETLDKLLSWRNQLGCPPQFGAPFGVWQDGRFEAVVAIRGVWWNGCKLLIPAGCGIIEASRLVNEWRELRLKREAVKRFLFPIPYDFS